MPGGVLPYQKEYITARLQTEMMRHDFRIGTLEAAIGTDLPFDEQKMTRRKNIIYARESDLQKVKDMGFDVVTLANNHVHDLSDEGVKNTMDQLTNLSISYCGAGLNEKEARKPAVISKDGETVAILAYCAYGKYYCYVHTAGSENCGVNGLDLDRCLSEIRDAKNRYDHVVVLPHWGLEYKDMPTKECIDMAKRMIDAGADAVLGSHTHRVQPLIKYHGKPICFSMSNFLFPDFWMYPPRPIWYPDEEEDLSRYGNATDYPFTITEPVKRVWMEISRVGCAISLSFSNGRVRARRLPIRLSEDNIVGFHPEKWKERIKTSLQSKRLEHPFLNMAIKAVKKAAGLNRQRK